VPREQCGFSFILPQIHIVETPQQKPNPNHQDQRCKEQVLCAVAEIPLSACIMGLWSIPFGGRVVVRAGVLRRLRAAESVAGDSG